MDEVANRGHRVKRPPNSFMLYRSDYAERIKTFLSHKNQQAVSKLAAKFWEGELPDVKTYYKELAEIEKQNHREAHPGYKLVRVKRKRLAAPKATLSRLLPREDSTRYVRSPTFTVSPITDLEPSMAACFPCISDEPYNDNGSSDWMDGLMKFGEEQICSPSPFAEPLSPSMLFGYFSEAHSVGSGGDWLEYWSDYSS
jgi:hypothetical protein